MRSMRDRAGVVVALSGMAGMAAAQCPGSWRTLGCGLGTPALGTQVLAFGVHHEDGPGLGPAWVFAGGQFGDPCLTGFQYTAILNGARWAAVAAGHPDGGRVRAFASFDEDGAGPGHASLFMGGHFGNIGGNASLRFVTRWSGGAWSAVGGGVNNSVHALTVFDDDGAGPNPPALIAGGGFTTAGGVAASRIARWDGTSWSALGAGLNGSVNAIAVFDEDGSGPNPPALFVGGGFTTAGGVSASNIARWDGSAWSALGGGVNGFVHALTVYDEDGDGPNPSVLIVGGSFSMAGGAPANRIARWDGSGWSALGAGLDGPVQALAAMDEGEALSTSLYVGGTFTTAGGVGVSNFARWANNSWWSPGGGTDLSVQSLRVVEAGEGRESVRTLYVGGTFSMAGGLPAVGVAAYNRFVAASVVSQPSHASVTEGGTATFSVQATGTHLQYQWRRNGVALGGYPCSGANTPTLTISPVGAAMAGTYDCVVTSPCGNVTSQPATLTVNAYCPQDTNGDGRTDFLDLNLILSFFGQDCPPAR